MSWIDDVVNQHAETESPSNFWFWSALATLSAVVKDQIWLDRGGLYKLYPNIYVMLHAESGLKKGPPVNLAKRIVKKVNNTRIISGRSSIQGILKRLGTAYTIPGGDVIKKSVGFIVASEFSSSLVNDPAAMTILTDLYDRNYNEGEWEQLLKMEEFTLNDPTVSLLVATNEAHFEDFIAKKDIQGGFIGRMFVIAENKVNRLNSLAAPLKNPPNLAMLSLYPAEISKLHGAFESLGSAVPTDAHQVKRIREGREIWYSKAGLLYDEWYDSFYHSITAQKVKDVTGTIQRFGDSVLKVGMLLSLGESTEMRMTEDHILRAVGMCEKLLGDVRKTTLGKRGKDESAERKALILNELLDRTDHQISKNMLMNKFWMHFKSEELDDIMHDFEVAGMVEEQVIGNQLIYRMPDDVVKQMQEYLAGKSSKNNKE